MRLALTFTKAESIHSNIYCKASDLIDLFETIDSDNFMAIVVRNVTVASKSCAEVVLESTFSNRITTFSIDIDGNVVGGNFISFFTLFQCKSSLIPELVSEVSW